jgi:hypothetical protein
MPLTRTRRRLLVATLVVVGMFSGGYWLLTQNVDPRFVGRWTVTTSKSSGIDWGLGIFGNGDAHVTISRQRRPMTYFAWKTEGNFLLFTSHDSGKNVVDRLRIQITLLRMKLFKEPTYTERYEILSVSPDSISLRWEEDFDRNGILDDIFTLRRIQP